LPANKIRATLIERRYSLLIRMKEFSSSSFANLSSFQMNMVLTEIPSGKMTVFKVQLRQSDVGRVIGRNGRPFTPFVRC